MHGYIKRDGNARGNNRELVGIKRDVYKDIEKEREKNWQREIKREREINGER